MWKTSIVIFIFVPSCYSYDLEVNVKMDNEFVDKVKSFLRNRKEPAAVQFDLNIPAEIIASLGIDQAKLFRTLDLPHKRADSSHSYIPTDFVEDLTKSGVDRLKTTCSEIESKLQTEADVSQPLRSAISGFITKLQHYIGNSLKLKAKCGIDKEIILLDTIEAANEIMYNETLDVIDYFGKNNTYLLKEDYENFQLAAYRHNFEDRKEDYKHMCVKLAFCRPYPGYFDYLGGLLGEVLGLTDNKLHNVVMKTAKVVKGRYAFFESVTGKKLIKKIGTRLQNLVDGDLTDVRDIITLFREIISQRRRWIYNEDVALNNKKRSMRIIMDVVDAAFHVDNEQAIMQQFEGTVNALRDWSKGKRNDVETILFSFVTYTIDALEKRWKKQTLSEMRTLMQLVMHGKAKGKQNSYLLTLGSNFTSKMKA